MTSSPSEMGLIARISPGILIPSEHRVWATAGRRFVHYHLWHGKERETATPVIDTRKRREDCRVKDVVARYTRIRNELVRMIHGPSSGFTDRTVPSTFRTCVINHATLALSERSLIIETSSEPSGVGQWHASDLPLLENRKIGPPKRVLSIQATSNAIFPLVGIGQGPLTLYDSVDWWFGE